jgi:hypothetical protein
MTDYAVAMFYKVPEATDERAFWDYETKLAEAWEAQDGLREPSSGADFLQRRVTLEAVWSAGTPDAAVTGVRLAAAAVIGTVGALRGVIVPFDPYAVHAELTVINDPHALGHGAELRM